MGLMGLVVRCSGGGGAVKCFHVLNKREKQKWAAGECKKTLLAAAKLEAGRFGCHFALSQKFSLQTSLPSPMRYKVPAGDDDNLLRVRCGACVVKIMTCDK